MIKDVNFNYDYYFEPEISDFSKENAKLIEIYNGIWCLIFLPGVVASLVLSYKISGVNYFDCVGILLVYSIIVLFLGDVFSRKNIRTTDGLKRELTKDIVAVLCFPVLFMVNHVIKNTMFSIIILMFIWCFLVPYICYGFNFKHNIVETVVKTNPDGIRVYAMFKKPMKEYQKWVSNEEIKTVMGSSVNHGDKFQKIMEQIQKEYQKAKDSGISEVGEAVLNIMSYWIKQRNSYWKEEEQRRKKMKKNRVNYEIH